MAKLDTFPFFKIMTYRGEVLLQVYVKEVVTLFLELVHQIFVLGTHFRLQSESVVDKAVAKVVV